jgi:ParB family chromosome partitioning protein
LPVELTRAFVNPQDLGIRNAMALKGLLKPEDRRGRAYKEAERLAEAQAANREALPVLEVIKALALAADPPNRSGSPNRSASPKKSGKPETLSSLSGKPVLRIEGADRKGIRLTLLNKGGASRQDAEEAIRAVLDQHWA